MLSRLKVKLLGAAALILGVIGVLARWRYAENKADKFEAKAKKESAKRLAAERDIKINQEADKQAVDYVKSAKEKAESDIEKEGAVRDVGSRDINDW